MQVQPANQETSASEAANTHGQHLYQGDAFHVAAKVPMGSVWCEAASAEDAAQLFADKADPGCVVRNIRMHH